MMPAQRLKSNNFRFLHNLFHTRLKQQLTYDFREKIEKIEKKVNFTLTI
jgi:hypothetical protein